MISQVGKLSLENYKTLKGKQKEEIDGKIEEKDVDVTLRFDFVIPMGSPFSAIYESLDEFKAEIERMEKAQQEKAEEPAEKE